MSVIRKWFQALFPDRFLWRLSLLNFIIIAAAIVLSSIAVYKSACALVDAMGILSDMQQSRFDATLFNYLLIFSVITILGGSLLHFILTRKLVKPIKRLVKAAKQLKMGAYPQPVQESTKGETGELVVQFNGLIAQLQANDEHRRKLISDISHEFRTPLTNLNGYLKSLERGDIEGNQELYHSLYQESKRLTAMLQQLEQLKEWDNKASINYTEHHETDIAEVIKQSTAMFKLYGDQNRIPINVNVESCVLSIHVEGIQQVMSNLLENAFQYYSGDGPIDVQGVKEDTIYKVSVSGESSVISDQESKDIFKRFYRIDHSRSRETGGSGLGLAIADEIIENHGGQMGLESQGNYNTFWFRLPL